MLDLLDNKIIILKNRIAIRVKLFLQKYLKAYSDTFNLIGYKLFGHYNYKFMNNKEDFTI